VNQPRKCSLYYGHSVGLEGHLCWYWVSVNYWSGDGTRGPLCSNPGQSGPYRNKISKLVWEVALSLEGSQRQPSECLW